MNSRPACNSHVRIFGCLASAALVTLCSCKGLPSARSNGPSAAPAVRSISDAPAAVAQPEQGAQGASAARAYPVQPVQYMAPTLPANAWTGEPMLAPGGMVPGAMMPPAMMYGGHVHGGGACPHCGPGTLPAFQFSDASYDPHGPTWMPDGLKGPWPYDEFICDGGDLNHDVYVKQDWTVVGIDPEDTVAHYDTLNGRTEVSASNCVCIYAPRFAAVRQVTSPILYEGHERVADVLQPEHVQIEALERGPRTAMQPEQPVAQLGLGQLQSLRERTSGLLVEQAARLVLVKDAFLPHEDLLFIQRGEFDASEKARLAERVAAAIVWTETQAVQILVAGQPAVEARGTAQPQETIVYELEGRPCLRICKIADKSEAKPGEIITFTLRFDNLGDQPVGNVTIIDHLTPRLEYVAGSAESTLQANFATQEQFAENETLVLRWEIREPIPVNGGGIVRFRARVR